MLSRCFHAVLQNVIKEFNIVPVALFPRFDAISRAIRHCSSLHAVCTRDQKKSVSEKSSRRFATSQVKNYFNRISFSFRKRAMVKIAPNLDLLLPKQEAGEENTSQVRKKSWIHSPSGQVSTLDYARNKKILKNGMFVQQ